MRFEPIKSSDPLFDDLLQRRGKFSFSMGELSEDWRLFMTLFGKMIIWRAEATWIDNRVHYHAVSFLFGVCPEGAQAPVYEFEFEEGEVTEFGGPPVRRIAVHAIGGSEEDIYLIIPQRKKYHEDDDLQAEDRGTEVYPEEGTVDGVVKGGSERST